MTLNNTGLNYTGPLIHRLSPGGSDGGESACNAGDPGLIPESGRSPGEGNGNPLQYSCLENSVDGGAWSMGHKESDTTERLHFHSPSLCGWLYGCRVADMEGQSKAELGFLTA